MRSFVVIWIIFTAFESRAQQNEASKFMAEVLAGDEFLSVELRDSLGPKNFSTLWTTAPNWAVYGSIGDDYQWIRIRMPSVIKDPSHPLVYKV